VPKLVKSEGAPPTLQRGFSFSVVAIELNAIAAASSDVPTIFAGCASYAIGGVAGLKLVKKRTPAFLSGFEGVS
jgi:hypothetical protein